MNAKRQTIWLVSMLSLMVVLSAYYLFTEDVNKLDLASTETINKSQEVKIDMSQVDPANAAKTDVKATTGGDAKIDTKAVTPQNSTKTDVKTTTMLKQMLKQQRRKRLPKQLNQIRPKRMIKF